MGEIPHRLDAEGNKIPRIAIMGEFSAGKSTLCNMLMNGDTLPRKVTATQLAPVWMTSGDGDHARVEVDGHETPISLEQLSSVPLDDTLYIRLGLPQEIFSFCDLIDFPGISDPNMDPEVWGRLLMEADAILWLTHATQAWRQTEAAVWDVVPEEVQEKSLLLLTRWDKVVNELDRKRIQRRLEMETFGMFKSILPISLTDAIGAGEDGDAWTASGAEAFMSALTEIITELKVGKPVPKSTSVEAPEQGAAAPVSAVRIGDVGPAEAAPQDPETPRVVPRRVRPQSARNTQRPRASA